MIHFDFDQAGWGSRTQYNDGVKLPWNPDKVVVHWGGGGYAAEGIQAEMARLRSWQNFHIDDKGWQDIAYNFGIGQSGNVYRLRGMNRSGATSGDFEPDGIPENHEAIAAVWIGGAKSKPSGLALASMARLINESGMSTVIGHQQVKSTACPGPDWMRFVDAEVWKELAPPPPPPWPQPDAWAEVPWQWGIDNGLVNRHTDPHDMVDKQELMTFLWRFAKTLS
jgi:N-acetylmuramoyl-L-alanine amidase